MRQPWDQTFIPSACLNARSSVTLIHTLTELGEKAFEGVLSRSPFPPEDILQGKVVTGNFGMQKAVGSTPNTHDKTL
jgi:hypothetical protein